MLDNLHKFGIECEKWAAFLTNEEQLKQQGCKDNELIIWKDIGSELGELGFLIPELSKSVLIEYQSKISEKIAHKSSVLDSTLTKRLRKELLDFLTV